MRVPILTCPCQHLLLFVMGCPFHLFRSCLILLKMFWSFQSTDFILLLLKLFPSILLFFDGIINVFFSLFHFRLFIASVWKCCWFLYVDLVFCSLVELIYSNNVLVNSLGFSVYVIMSPVFTDSFISCFPVWMPFIYFSRLIALARTSHRVLNRSGKNVHLVFFLILGRKHLIFHH